MTDAQTAAPEILRAHAETAYADELAALAAADDRPRPPSWQLSPWAVATYLLGGTLPDGTVITPEVHRARAGWSRSPSPRWPPTGRCCCWACRARPRPGSASTWPPPSRGDSTLLVQGTAGTPEEAIRYGWNYARLLAEGPSRGRPGGQPDDARHGRRAGSRASRS